MTLRCYASLVAYLQSLVEGAARVDLDGHGCGEVSAAEAAFAAVRLVEALAKREASRAAREPAAAPPSPSKPTPALKSPTSEPVLPAMSRVLTRVRRPLLRLPAVQRRAMSTPPDPFAFDAEFGDPNYVKLARDPKPPPETGPEWQRDGRASPTRRRAGRRAGSGCGHWRWGQWARSR